jgi:hypothetical protein
LIIMAPVWKNSGGVDSAKFSPYLPHVTKRFLCSIHPPAFEVA